MELIVGKELLRKKLLTQLLSLAREEIERRSSDVQNNLSKLPAYKKAKTIMVYYPTKGEVDILGLVRNALGEKKVCFPVIDQAGGKIIPYAINSLESDFKKGPYGIREPDPQHTQPVPKEKLDVVLVPGLAFDRQKNRLGRGGGYYDRFLKSLDPATVTVGVAFDLQVLPTLPAHEAQDVKVNILAAETFVI